MTIHGAVASLAYGNDARTQAVLADWRTAPIDERLRAMLGFLEKLTFTPEAMTANDAQELKQMGLSDEAVEDAIHVNALFSIYVRLADAFSFHQPDSVGYAQGAKRLLKRGYK